MSAHTNSPFVQAFQLGSGFASTQALLSFCRLKIPSILKGETKNCADIAAACATNPSALYRFLRFLSKLGVVELVGQNCKLTPIGQLLRPDLPGNLVKGLELMSMEPWQKTWAALEYSLKTGKSAFAHANQQEPWDFLSEHQQYGKPFNEWMTALSKMSAGALLINYAFPQQGTICDVGGGHGFLLRTILQAHPEVKGILFDLPFVVAEADLGETQARCQIVPGDFFQTIPPADLIILKSILHDWDNEHAVKILQNCAAGLNPGGKILAMDMLISDEASMLGYFYDIHMMLMMGGRERTAEEFHALFAEAGLEITQIIPTASPQVIIEAKKV